MKANDLFADHVNVGGPELVVKLRVLVAEAEGGDVVAQRIEPNVNDVGFVAGDGDAPLESGATDGEIFQSAAHEGDDLVATSFRTNEVGIGGVKLEQRLFHRRELEEIVFFFHGLSDASADRAGRAGGVDLDVELVVYAILAAIFALVDETAILKELEHGLHTAHVFLIRGADELVVAEAHAVPERAELGGYFVNEFLRRAAGSIGGALDLLAVFIGAG